MAEDLEKKLKTIAVAITLLVTATGAWTSVVVRGVDIASNKEDIVTLKTSTEAELAKIKTSAKEVVNKQDIKNTHLEERSHNCEKIQAQMIVRQEGMAENIKAIREAITIIAQKEFGTNP